MNFISDILWGQHSTLAMSLVAAQVAIFVVGGLIQSHRKQGHERPN